MYGHIYRMSEAVVEGAREVEGAEVSLYQVAELVPEEALEKIGAKAARSAFEHLPIATPSQLLLIRLFQQAPSGSVGECLARHFRRLCPSFSRSLPARKHASSIWPLAAGRMASCVRAAGTGAPMNW
jgi:hypothetical protein